MQNISPDKAPFFNQKVQIFFLFLHKKYVVVLIKSASEKKKYVVILLEAPRRGASNEYHNIFFVEK